MNIRATRWPKHLAQCRGYTLIEVLIAVAIFSTLSVAAYSALNGLSQASQSMQTFEQELAELQIAVARLDSDIQSLVVRPQWGPAAAQSTEAFFGRGQALGGLRSGWANPLQQPRANVQRFQWQWQANRIERVYALSLHTDPSESWQREVLLEGISDWSIEYLAPSGSWQTAWGGGNGPALPEAIAYSFQHPRFGLIRRVLVVD